MCNKAGLEVFEYLSHLSQLVPMLSSCFYAGVCLGLSAGVAAFIVQRWLMFVCCRGPRSTCKCPWQRVPASSGLVEIQTSSGWISVWNECRSSKCELQAVGL